ncbi:MAG TPA: flagellar biosynthesis protein FlhA [bacterium]|nr:flagellar biosynthesis protein FlhA [Candidatus Omnitrophota bacterium]HOJ59809.1 flagellar biosynthesis protein FlhA [bacterium]HOL93491.1 flagellar biosynthesis protein FlhA [bacterium]HPP00898.1 flagellar biosynthesis protein FlhA [bacterium]
MAAVPARKTAAQQTANMTVAFAVVSLVGVMLGQVPPSLLSLLLAANITLALLVLMLSLYMANPLEISTFPTILLILTFFRLALNVASTKLILTPGTGALDKAGAVIEFFGQVVAGNNPIIGFVVFLILIIIQFVVITKGSGRIAEVAARFTLDAMPGKQMAIDADLNAGLITEAEARARRAGIAREADFYGAMDGASKFVRGDAIAGIIITVINLLGGFGVGYSENLAIVDVLQTYTILTIGDGLVTQIPALLTSTAAGVVVTRASEETALGESLAHQLFARPEAMFVAAAALFVIASLGLLFSPGIVPPFLFLALLLGGSAWRIQRAGRATEEERKRELEQEAVTPPAPESVESLLEVDPMEIEIGFSLISIVDSTQGGDLLDRVSVIRRQTAVELGIIVPPIRIRDNMQLSPRQYQIRIRGIKAAEGEIRPDRLLAMKPDMTEEDDIPGIRTVEPAFGTPAKWIEPDERSRAEMSGYSVVEPAAVLATHLTEVIRSHAHEILGRQETQQLIDHLKERNPVLVNELIEVMHVKIGLIQKILQNLLRERVPIRHLELIFEAIADYAEMAQMNPDTLTEYCRMNLARVITYLYTDASGQLPVITLDPNIETRILEGMQRGGAAGIMATDPVFADKVISAIHQEANRAMASGYHPLVLTTPPIRAHLKRLCERSIPHLIVLSYNEIAPEVPVTRISTVRWQSESEKVPS